MKKGKSHYGNQYYITWLSCWKSNYKLYYFESSNSFYICVILKVALSHSHLSDFASTAAVAPVLQVDRFEATEGDMITLTCTAPVKPYKFYFYRDFIKIRGTGANSNQEVFQESTISSGSSKYHCRYTVLIDENTYYSMSSNTVTVSVDGKCFQMCKFIKDGGHFK